MIHLVESCGRPWGIPHPGGAFGKASQGREAYSEHLGGTGSLLGALSEGDFDKVVESSRPWEEEGKFQGEGTRDPPIRPSPLAPPSLSLLQVPLSYHLPLSFSLGGW